MSRPAPVASVRRLVGDAPRQGPWLFGADVDAVQLTWARLGPGPVRITAVPAPSAASGWRGPTSPSARVIDLDVGPGPGSVLIGELEPDTAHLVEVDDPVGPGWRRRVRTLPALDGPELFRFATISDLHLGETSFGFLGRLAEDRSEGSGGPPGARTDLEAYSIRAARAAVDELTAWGAQLLIAKGDLTDTGVAADWDAFASMTAHRPYPVLVIPGNHDTWEPVRSRLDPLRRTQAPRREEPRLSADEGRRRLGQSLDPVQVHDAPGVRLVAADTTRPDSRAGQIRPVADAVVDAVAGGTTPAVVLLHHQLMATPVPTHLPVGIPQAEADPFLDALATAQPATLVTSGHTHRHRRRTHGPLVITEVGSTKDFPGTWAGYVVHADGIRQVVRRIAAPDILAWTDTSARAALGAWGRWSPGTLSDRCFTHRWPR